MITSTKDILFLILGISILVVSFFICFFLYYLIKMVRNFYKAGRVIERTGEKLNEIVHSVERKIKEISLLPLLSEAIKVVIEFLKERKGKKEEKKEEK